MPLKSLVITVLPGSASLKDISLILTPTGIVLSVFSILKFNSLITPDVVVS